MFIYLIRNKKNGKVYVGQTNELVNIRWNKHKYRLRKNTHHNSHLQAAWNKYGESNFDCILIDKSAKTQNELDSLEEHYRKVYISTSYNLRVGGEGVGKHNQDTIKKMRAAQTKVWKRKGNKTRRKLQAIRMAKQSKRQWKDGTITNQAINQMIVGSRKTAKYRGKHLAKAYKGLVSPKGKIYDPIVNLRKFCRIHRLDRANINRVLNGTTTLCKGWRKL